ncbi:MAG: FMN-binding protein [Jatrophihabitantaceae bacterium]
MKRISYFAMSTLTALVLLLGYRTSTSSHAANAGAVVLAPVTGGSATSSTATSSAGSPPTGSTSSSAGSASSTGSAAGKPTSAASASAASATKTVTGSVADTRWGPVQVQLTVQGGKVTNVSVIQYPNGNSRDQEINSQALPILINETLSAQSAKVDMVSGATYTSQGYLSSLQSALDQAGI